MRPRIPCARRQKAVWRRTMLFMPFCDISLALCGLDTA